MSLLNLPAAKPAAAPVLGASRPKPETLAIVTAISAGVLALVLFAGGVGTVVYFGGDPFGLPPGPRGVVVIHESSKDGVKDGILWTTFQSGEAAAYRKEKGHTAVILDQDGKNKTDGQIRELEEWKAALGDIELPAMLIYDLKSRKILDKRHIPEGTTAAQMTDWLDAKDG